MIPAELPSFGSSPNEGQPRSSAGRCGICGKSQAVRFADYGEVRIGFCCLYDALRDAESVLRSAAIHKFTGCPKDLCAICVMARG